MDRFLDIALIILIGGAALIALLTAIAILFPRPVERTRDILAGSFWHPFLIGLVNFLFVGAIAALLARSGQRAGGVLAAALLLLALLLAIALTVFSVLGLSALTSLAGERIGEGTSPFRRHLRGSLLLVLAGLTPFVGWYAFAPIAAITGLGAALQATFRRKEKAA